MFWNSHMKNLISHAALAALVVSGSLCTASLVRAEPGSTVSMNSDTRGRQPTADEKMMAEKEFVKGAYSVNMLHVKASEYALSQVDDPQVRQLAEKLIEDHTMAMEKLSAIAKTKGIELSPELLPPQKAMLEQAMKTKGEMFAFVYLINMTTLHVGDILKASHVANDASDPEIKAFAAESLPVLREHYKMILPMAEAKVKLQDSLASK